MMRALNEVCLSKDFQLHFIREDFPCSLAGKESACNAGDLGLISGLGRSLGEGKGYPLQYSCLENPRDGGVWWAAVCGVAQSQTRMKRLSSSPINRL